MVLASLINLEHKTRVAKAVGNIATVLQSLSTSNRKKQEVRNGW
jgi:hypothetical protein